MTSKHATFHKLQAQGNDFILLDLAESSWALDREQIKRLCHRQWGVGCDQLLILGKLTAGHVPLQIFNANGQEVLQCGNGLRAAGYYLMERYQWRSDLILSVQGIAHRLWYHHDKLHVALPVPCFSHEDLPQDADNSMPSLIWDQPWSVNFHAVHVGNPHAVIVNSTLSSPEKNQVARALSQANIFSKGTNVGFMQVHSPDKVALSVFERGVGYTLACGSGACAAVVVGIRLGLLNQTVHVHMPGGDLQVSWPSLTSEIVLSGSCQWVFSGQWRGEV